MKKNWRVLVGLLFIFTTSCNNEMILDEKSDSLKTEEDTHLLSNKYEFSENEAIQLLQLYSSKVGDQGKLKSRSTSRIKVTNSKKEYIEIEQSIGVNSRSLNASDSVVIYSFETEDGPNKGFGIVVGDKRFPHVLSYVENGSLIDTVYNEGLKEWVNSIPMYINEIAEGYNLGSIDNIEYADATPANPIGTPYPTVRDSAYLAYRYSMPFWGYEYRFHNAYFVVTQTFYHQERILQTKWSQGSPYNNLMRPMPAECNSSANIYTGCVATALTQLLAEYEHPKSYNWKLLKETPMIYNNSALDKKNEVARLMLDIQNQLNVSFNCKETGVARNNTEKVLGKYFNYTKKEYLELYSMYKYPMLVLGQTSENTGHAFIADGYAEIEYAIAGYCEGLVDPRDGTIVDPIGKYHREIYTELQPQPIPNPWINVTRFPAIHINWGWGGSSDGWYQHISGNRYNHNMIFFTNLSKKG